MATHQVSIRPDYRGHGRYTYSFYCSCGAHGFGSQSKGAAEQAGRQHQKKAGER
jgi:hypothetical protein